ncbi:putative cross-wall-targeting lipoprotein signal domain-containing proteiin [Idiomarina sp. X4]
MFSERRRKPISGGLCGAILGATHSLSWKL